MNNVIREEKGFTFVDHGKGPVLLLLHGLFGALSNWEAVTSRFSSNFRVLIPMLPIYTVPVREAGLEVLVKFVEDYVEAFALDDMIVMGNSLGGHVALIYTLRNQSKVKKLVLTGSSGLFENSMGGSFPRRGSYDYIKERVEYTFYDPRTATKELIDEIFDTVGDIPKCLRIVAIAKSAQRHNMAAELPSITVPTLLIWGLNDTITPVSVAYEFSRRMPNTTLRFIDQCCHAPMMEHPGKFNELASDFLLN